MAERLYIRLLTPQKKVLDQETDYILLQTTDGQKGILPNHEPCTVLLGPGLLTIKTNDVSESVFLLGGVASVQNSEVVVLTPSAAATKEELEQALAQLEAQKSERQAEEFRSELTIERAEIALRNALVRMESGSYSVIGARLHDPVRETERKKETDKS